MQPQVQGGVFSQLSEASYAWVQAKRVCPARSEPDSQRIHRVERLIPGALAGPAGLAPRQ